MTLWATPKTNGRGIGNMNQARYIVNANHLHDMPVMHLAERRRAQQIKVRPAGQSRR